VASQTIWPQASSPSAACTPFIQRVRSFLTRVSELRGDVLQILPASAYSGRTSGRLSSMASAFVGRRMLERMDSKIEWASMTT